MVAIKPTIGLCKRTAGLEEGNRKPKHPLLAAGLRFWPPTLCFRGKLRSFYLFEYEGTSAIALAQQVSQDRDVESIHQLKGVSHERNFTGNHCSGRC
jgi:hypothetical protein